MLLFSPEDTWFPYESQKYGFKIGKDQAVNIQALVYIWYISNRPLYQWNTFTPMSGSGCSCCHGVDIMSVHMVTQWYSSSTPSDKNSGVAWWREHRLYNHGITIIIHNKDLGHCWGETLCKFSDVECVAITTLKKMENKRSIVWISFITTVGLILPEQGITHTSLSVYTIFNLKNVEQIPPMRQIHYIFFSSSISSLTLLTCVTYLCW